VDVICFAHTVPAPPGEAGTTQTITATGLPGNSTNYFCLLLGMWGSRGTGNGQFQSPMSVDTDGGSIYVADLFGFAFRNSMVQEGLSGRGVSDGIHAAGRHSVSWNGHNSADRPVASGVYFVRLTGDGFTAVRKAVLLK